MSWMRLRIILCGLIALIFVAGCSQKTEYSEAVDLLISDVWVSQVGSERITFLDSYVGNIDNKARPDAFTAFTWDVISEKPSGYSIIVRRKDGSLILDDDYLLKYEGEIPVLIDTFWNTQFMRECDLQ